MEQTFDNICIYPHSGKIQDPNDRIHKVIDAIRAFGDTHHISVIEEGVGNRSPRTDKRTLFISVGGDGTMLKAVKEAVKRQASTLGINLGNLGFLTDFDAYNEYLESLTELLNDILNNTDEVYLDKRLILQGYRKFISFGAKREKHLAVNEFLIAFEESMRGMLEYDIYASGRFVARQSGSGVIIATPTGSTAFSLSVGGPIISPRSNSILVVPIAAHTLTSRPIIVSGVRDTIEIRAKNKPGRSIKLYADDKVIDSCTHLDNEFIVQIKPYKAMARFWHRRGWNFFDVLSEKMKWG